MDKEKNICPLCGKSLKDEEKFCYDCQELAQHELPEFYEHEALPLNEVILPPEETETPEETKFIERKSHKKRNILLFISAAIFIGAGIVGGLEFKKMKEAEEVELNYWNLSIEENTPSSYTEYLIQYPSGEYSEEAKKRIAGLHEQENSAWEKVKGSEKKEDFYTFIDSFPYSDHKEEIAIKTDSLSWLSAKKKNTKASYQAYMDSVSEGKYIGNYLSKAEEEYKNLDQPQKITGKELTKVTSRITELAKLLSSYQYTKARGLMASKIDYLEHKDKTPMFVTEDLRTTINKNKIKTVTYTPQTNSMTVLKDNQGIYHIEVPVSKKIVYKARNKKSETLKMALKIDLDKDLKLRIVQKK